MLGLAAFYYLRAGLEILRSFEAQQKRHLWFCGTVETIEDITPRDDVI
jgi:hypothetical protein